MLRLLDPEFVNGHLSERLAWSEDRVGKRRSVWRIGEMLRFQAQCRVLRKVAAGRRAVEEIAGVELYGGLSSINFHHATGLRIAYLGGEPHCFLSRTENVAVIVAARLVGQLVDVGANLLRRSEIERRSCDARELTGMK